MSRIQNLLAIFCVCLLSGPVCAGENASDPVAVPVPAAAAVPEWASGVIVIRNFGRVLDKIAAYSNQTVPNLGELAKQYATNFIFKQIPVSAGVKRDGPVFLYPLADFTPETKDEACLVLPVEDAAALKTSLSNVLGFPTEENGILSFSIPQPLPNPDRLLLAKFVKERLFLAPSVELLKQLETFVTASTPEQMAGDALGGDVVISEKVARLRKKFGKVLETSLEAGALTAAQGDVKQSIKLLAAVRSALNTFWQLDVFEVALSIHPQSEQSKTLVAALEVRGRASDGTDLQKIFAEPVPTIHHVNPLLPSDLPLALQFGLQGQEVAAFLKNKLQEAHLNTPDEVSGKMFINDMLPAFFKLIELSEGDCTLALLPLNRGTPKSDGLTALLALDLRGKAAIPVANDALKSLIEKTVLMIDAAVKDSWAEADALANKDARPVSPKSLVTHRLRAAEKDAKFQTWEFDAPTITSDAERKIMDRLVGWPLTLSHTTEITTLFLTTGKNSSGALKSILANPAKDAPLKFPKGTCLRLSLKPISLTQTLLQTVVPQGGKNSTEIEQLLAGLKDDTLSLSARIADGTAALRLELPSTVPAALIPLTQRIAHTKIDWTELFRELNEPEDAIGNDAVHAPKPAPEK